MEYAMDKRIGDEGIAFFVSFVGMLSRYRMASRHASRHVPSISPIGLITIMYAEFSIA